MRKDLVGIYQTLSKVRNLNQDTQKTLQSGLPTIQDLTFSEDPLGGYKIPEPIIKDFPAMKAAEEEDEKKEDPKIPTKAEVDEQDKKAKATKEINSKSIDELVDLPDRFL